MTSPNMNIGVIVRDVNLLVSDYVRAWERTRGSRGLHRGMGKTAQRGSC